MKHIDLSKRLLSRLNPMIVVSLLALIMPVASLLLSPASLTASSGMSLVSTFKSDACAGLSSISTSQDCGSGNSGVTHIVSEIVSILSLVVGVLAVIFVIVAGMKYITSSGDSNKISSAKSTLVYAIVGIAVAALAQLIVHTVLNTAIKSAG